MSEGTNILMHINTFKKLITRFHNVEIKVEEEDQALLLLSSLPESYDNLVTTILYGKDMLKMEEVKVTLVSKEKRDKPAESEGLLTKSSGQNRGSQNNRGDKKTRGCLVRNQEDKTTIISTTSKKVIGRKIVPR